MKQLRQIVPPSSLQEGFFKKIRQKAHAVKQSFKTWTNIERGKDRTYHKLGVRGEIRNKSGKLKPVPKLLHKLHLPADLPNRWRKFKHGHVFQALFGSHKSRPTRQHKLKASSEPKAKVSSIIPKTKSAYKPPKQKKDVT